MKTEANEKAHGQLNCSLTHENHLSEVWVSEGLTKREHFAAMALQGLLASGFETTMEQHSKLAVEAADALINELNN